MSKTIQTVLAALTIFCASCSKEAPKRNLPNDVANYFSVSNAKLLGTENYNVVLKDEAFNQIFLLSASIIEGAPAPSGNALANKLIYFIKQKSKVYMFESLQGKLSTNSVKTKKFLAEFNIVKTYNDSVTIDFKNGMNSLFANSAMYGSDFSSPNDDKDTVLNVTSSFLNKIELRGKYLYINEIARVTREGKNDSLEIKYVISPYQTNNNFKSTVSNQQKRVGFFEVNPIIEAGTGKKTINIMKFDINKDIVYYISQNIPKEYKQAVKDGVLYWNSIFGREVLKLKSLPENRDVHEPELNVVKWLHWDSAGFAYANMQADPLTGETLQSEIYMTSVFGLGGYKRAKIYLNRIKANENQNKTKSTAIGFRGFKSARICNFDLQKSAQDLSAIVSQVEQLSSDEKERNKLFLRLSQDYVRSVTAHEIGHTLGLRHNFAGSTSTELSYSNFKNIFKKYITTGSFASTIRPSSTVMDYTPTSIASMNGAFIRLKMGPLPYDKAAISWGYKLTDITLEDIPVFCTDSHKSKNLYTDCKVWDYLNNPIEGNLFSWEQSIKNIGIDLAYSMNSLTKLTDEEALKKLKSRKIDSDSIAKKMVTEYYSAMLDTLKADASFITIKTNFEEDQLDYYNLQIYQEQVEDFQKKTTDKHNGLSKVVLSKLQIKDGKTIARIEAEKLFNSTLTTAVPNASAALTSAIKIYSKKYFNLFDKALLFTAGQSLSSLEFKVKDPTFIKDLTKLIDHVSFDRQNKIMISSGDISVNQPIFSYQKMAKNDFGVEELLDVRNIISKLIKVDFYPKSPSYRRNVDLAAKTLTDKYKSEKNRILGTDTSRDTLSDPLYDWLQNEDKVLNSLK